VSKKIPPPYAKESRQRGGGDFSKHIYETIQSMLLHQNRQKVAKEA